MPTGEQVLAAQVANGSCVLGTTPGWCKMADGSEEGCNFIRECRPDLHFEYASGYGGGRSPNVNIWAYQDLNAGGVPSFVWNGPAPAPNFAPTFGTDPFSGGVMPLVDYASYFTGTIPAPRVPSTAPSSFVPVNVQTAAPATPGGSSVPIAPAYTGGLRERMEQMARTLYGSTVITQNQFCILYQSASGFPCDFEAATPGSKEVSAWLSQLQQDQDRRVSVLGSRPFNGSSNPAASTPARPAVPAPAQPKQQDNTMLYALIGLGVILALRK